MKLQHKLLGLLVLVLLSVTGCDRNEIDVASQTDFPPGILSTFPIANSMTVREDFDIKAIFVDGSTSPLASGSMSLQDADGNELASTSGSLSGLRDSLVIPAADFNPNSLDFTDYQVVISVSDQKGQTSDLVVPFTLTALPFAANHNEMWIAGAFNGWGADAMTLVADHIWEIEGVDLENDGWKFKNCFDWCDEDWGDPDCDGFMNSNMATGNGNTECGYSGDVRVRFNDATLSYSVAPLVELESNVSGLFLLGNFNDFEGNEFQFSLTENNTWVLAEALIAPGDRFKFAEMPDLMGTIYGDDEGDGIAEPFGGNIVFSGDQEAFYSFMFNDQTLEYSFEFLRLPSVGIIGDATPGGWAEDTDMNDDDGDGIYTINLELMDGFVKFRANDDWPVNWGGATGTADDFPAGDAVFNSDFNIPVVAGVYDITLNTNDLTYSFEADGGITSIGIIGDATPGGWAEDTDMTDDDGDGIWEILIGLGSGQVKFRANDDWPQGNWGGATGTSDDFPSGIGVSDSPDNIPVEPGLYVVTFNLNTLEYSFAPATMGIIGDATPTAWDSDTDLTFDAASPNLMEIQMDLVVGGAKFRLNDDWPPGNWGGPDFPNGIGILDSPDNIPVDVAGNYVIQFNVLTKEYNFQLQ
ncbi:MAG: hypothetical protein AAF433_11430 [Bacteroidota bacterium]